MDEPNDTPPPAGEPGGGRRSVKDLPWRAIGAWAAVVLGGVVALVASLTIWVNRQALDTDSWVNASTELLADDEVREALSIYLVDELYSASDVQARLDSSLPSQLKPLAGPISGGLRSVAQQGTEQLLASSQVQRLWEELNRRAHTLLVDLLEEKDTRALQAEGGDVVLNLQPLLERVRARVGIDTPLRPDAGRITIMRSDQLEAAQTAVKVIRVLSVLLGLVVVALFALGIWLGVGQRRRLLIAAGASLVIVGLIDLVARRLAGRAVVDALSGDAVSRPAAQDVWQLSTTLLRDVGVALVIYGLIAILGAWLAGPSRWATWVRRRSSPYMARPVPVYVVLAALILMVLLFGPNLGNRTLLGTLILLVLVVAGVEVLRRRILAEFPPEPRPAEPAPA